MNEAKRNEYPNERFVINEVNYEPSRNSKCVFKH